MKLRGIDFGHVWDASGSRGFFGEGYRYQKVYGSIGMKPRHEGTFISKTATIQPNEGNMPLAPDGFSPRDWKPKCIKVYPTRCATLNAVGLSNPGLKFLLDTGKWQSRKDPFMISFMPISEKEQNRIRETREFVALLESRIDDDSWAGDFGIQLNLRCPNRKLDSASLVNEAMVLLSLVASLEIPVILKFDSTLDVEAALQLSRHPHCDAISISNAVKWRDVPLEVRSEQFGTAEISPLEQYGGGALSGRPILPLTMNWLDRAKHIRFGCPIAIGGGIMMPEDAEWIIRSHDQIQAIELGTVRMLRPWRYDSIYDHAYNIFTRSGRRSLRPPDNPIHAVPA